MNIFRISAFLILFILTLSCTQTDSGKIEDLIPPVKLVAGKEIKIFINDLFYLENYDISFKSNPNVKINYDQSQNSIDIKSDDNFEGLTLVEFEVNNEVYDLPIISKTEKYYKFTYKPDEEFKSINLFGSFNGWNRHNILMTDEDSNGVFEAEVPLDPGVHQYKFFGDGKEIVDPDNPAKVPNGFGDFNSVRTIEDMNRDKFFLHLAGYKPASPRDIYSFELENETATPMKTGDVYVLLNNRKVDDTKVTADGNMIDVSLDRLDMSGKNILRAIVSVNGRVSNIQTVVMFDGKPINNDQFTWHDGIIYSIMIDRFNDGDPSINNPVQHDSLQDKANYMGGDLQGVIDKIDENYFDELGVNTIWISPVYDNPNEAYKEYPAPHRYYSGYHGYWPIHHQRIEEKFGDMNKLKELVDKAHKHNVKVLLDFVSNHVHEQHVFFKNHRDWFGKLELDDGRLNLRFWDEFRLTTWFEPYLPSFDYLSSDEALEASTDNAVWWLKQSGADGYRHDAVKHVPNEFWRALMRKLNSEVKPDRDLPIYQIGETFGSYELISSYVNNGQLHSQFNFNLYDVALPTFIREDGTFAALDKEMKRTFDVYGPLHLMGNVMDSHDKNRFMAFADGDLDASEWSAIEVGWNNPPEVDDPENYKKLILYMAYMNTIPGLPVIYYGSEFGMTGASDPDNRRMMRFNDDLTKWEKGTLEEVKKVINIRKEHSALRYGDFYTLQADSDIYAYLRSDMNERLLVVLNKNDKKKSVSLQLPQQFSVSSATSLGDGQNVPIDNNVLNINVDEMNWIIMRIE